MAHSGTQPVFSFDGHIAAASGDRQPISLRIERPAIHEKLECCTCEFRVEVENTNWGSSTVGDTLEVAQQSAAKSLISTASKYGLSVVNVDGTPTRFPLPPLIFSDNTNCTDTTSVDMAFSGMIEDSLSVRSPFKVKVWHVGERDDGHHLCRVSAHPLLPSSIEVSGYDDEYAMYRAHQFLRSVISYAGFRMVNHDGSQAELPAAKFTWPEDRSDIEVSFSAFAKLPAGEVVPFSLNITRPFLLRESPAVAWIFCPFISKSSPLPIVGVDQAQARVLAIEFVRNYLFGQSWEDVEGRPQASEPIAELIDERGHPVDLPESISS